jgi:hypothetical protein
MLVVTGSDADESVSLLIIVKLEFQAFTRNLTTVAGVKRDDAQ